MSKWSEYRDCPNCKNLKVLRVWEDGSFINHIRKRDIFKDRGYLCLGCGIYMKVENCQLQLKELNDKRAEWNKKNKIKKNSYKYLKPLIEQPSVKTIEKMGFGIKLDKKS